jgi:hypothetical protein
VNNRVGTIFCMNCRYLHNGVSDQFATTAVRPVEGGMSKDVLEIKHDEVFKHVIMILDIALRLPD